MSGIVGILNLDGAPVDRDLLSRMTQSMAARGPDAQNVWVESNLGFGHTMLRTTWESETEHQPLTLDGHVWITADCRVDARQELIHELTARGCPVSKDAPDPELILHAYAVWGEACAEHLLGDFSFAIWDGRRRTLYAARDHFGVKPFHYARVGNAFIFSNTLNCLRLHPAVSNQLDDVAIADFLVFGSAQDLDRTSFSAIRRLPQAHVLTISGAEPSLKRYWEFPMEDELHYQRRDEYIEHFLELLELATRDRLRTNKVGVFMSGGLDSTTIAAMAHKILSASGPPFDLRAHTVVFDRIIPDEERKYSRMAADGIGIPIHHYPLDDYRFPPDKPEPNWYPPEPGSVFDRGRAIEIQRGPAAASRVLLWAHGSDPIIEASAEALEHLVGERQYGRLLKDFIWLMWARRQLPKFGIRTVLRNALGRAAAARVSPYPDWLEPGLERRLDMKGRWLARERTKYPIRFRALDELSGSSWSRIFESTDPGSMQLAAEARFPFFDLRLVRYLLRVPQIPWYIEKSLLRLAMKGILPDQILRRPKAPLAGNPLAHLLPPANTLWWEQYLGPSNELEHFVNLDAAKAVMAKVVKETQATNEHRHIDVLRLSLRPIGLNLWLQRTAFATP